MTRTAHPHMPHSHSPQPDAPTPKVKRRRRRPPHPPRQSWLGKGLFAFAAFVILLAGAITAAIFVFDPASIVRSELIRQVKINTGRDLSIAGKPSLTFFPSIGISLPQIAVSPPPGMQSPPTIRADRLHVTVAMLPLLGGSIVIERIGLDRPVIDLHIDKSGRRSWQIAALPHPNRPATQLAMLPTAVAGVTSDVPQTAHIQMATLLAAQPQNSLGVLENLELRELRIDKGRIQYRDERSGAMQVISDADIEITGRRTGDPLLLDGAVNWNNERLNIKAHLEKPADIVHGRTAKARFSLQSRPVNASFNGNLTLAATISIAGPLEFTTPSLQHLALLAGTNLPAGKQLGALTLKGDLNATGTQVVLRGAQFSLGQTQSSGDIAVEFADTRPKIKADLRVSKLDIDKLSASFKDASPISSEVAKQSTARAQSIEDVLHKTQPDAGRFSPQTNGSKKSAGWSREPIDITAMQLIDADARLQISDLRVSGLAIDKTALRIALTNGNARADLDTIELYGGAGRGVLAAQPDLAKGLKVSGKIAASNVSAQRLLKDAADLDLIAGTARLTAEISSNGSSEYDLMSNLSGKSSFTFTDGAIVGWNIPQILRGLQTGQISDFNRTPAKKTDFSELSASFSISRGIANTQDLRMSSPLLRTTGSGNTDIGRRQLDMILRPRLVASLSGQGGQTNLNGIEIPIRFSGPWHNIQPDLSAILSDPAIVRNTVDTVGRLRDRLKGKKADDIVRDFLGKNGDGNSDGASELLKNLFKN